MWLVLLQVVAALSTVGWTQTVVNDDVTEIVFAENQNDNEEINQNPVPVIISDEGADVHIEFLDGGQLEPSVLDEIFDERFDEHDDEDDDGDETEDSDSAAGVVALEGINYELNENGDLEFFEGDMILTEEQKELQLLRKASTNLWPNGDVPYDISGYSADVTPIMDGINHWLDNTCLNFFPVIDTNAPHLKFIDGTGCYSYVGYISSFAGQDVSIQNPGCTSLGTVAHEIGHAIGFNHEHSRTGRDAYVNILFGNIDPNKVSNFNERTTNNYNIEYDYNSALHYGSMSFSNNGEATIATIDPFAQPVIGQRTGLSFRDIKIANLMYGCIDMWQANCGGSNPCQNEGYVGNDCACVCKQGTTGQNCETIVEDYNQINLHQLCLSDVTITAPMTYSTPQFPAFYPTGYKCTKKVQAPACTFPKITVVEFDMLSRSSRGRCEFDGLEIRFGDEIYGGTYCDNELAAGDEFTTTTSDVVYIIHSNGYNSYSAGYSLDISFVPSSDPNCSPTTQPPATQPPATNPSPLIQWQHCNKSVWYDPSTSTVHWLSVNHPQNYPHDYECSFIIYTTSPRAMLINFNYFNLKKCKDYVTMMNHLDKTTKYCKRKTGLQVKSPNFYNHLRFKTDSKRALDGFNITMQVISTPCHTSYDMTDGQEVIITTTEDDYMCEWMFKAASGSPSLIFTASDFQLNKFKSKKDCVIIDPGTTSTSPTVIYGYPSSRSTVYCKKSTPPATVVSTGDVFKVMLTKRKPKATLSFKVQAALPVR